MSPEQWTWDTNQLGPALLLAFVTFFLGALIGPILLTLLKRLGLALEVTIRNLFSRFPHRYKNYVSNKFTHIDIKGLKTHPPMPVPLDSVYVPLKLRAKQEIGSVPVTDLSLDEILNKTSRLIILGEAGSGKSTLLGYVAWAFSTNNAHSRLRIHRKLLPIHLALRKLRIHAQEGELPNIVDLLMDEYERIGLAPSRHYFLSRLRKGQCVVLLDGLDEIPDTQSRQLMSDWIEHMTSLFPDNIFLVSSRPQGYESVALAAGFRTFYVQDFDRSQIRLFVRKWVLAIENAVGNDGSHESKTLAEKKADDLVQAINSNAAVEELAANPLLLSIVALVHRYRAPLPEQRRDLYSECTDVLLGYWDEGKGLAGQVAPAKKRSIMQGVALSLHRNGTRSLPRAGIEQAIADSLLKLSNISVGAVEFLDDILERSGLLSELEYGTFGFAHLSFQEYLTACEIADYPSQAALLFENIHHSWWRQVLTLYVQISDATPVIEMLISDNRPCDDDLLLAGQIAAQTERVTPEVLEQVKALLDVRLMGELSSEHILEFAVPLAKISDLSPVSFFCNLAARKISQTTDVFSALGLYLARLRFEALSNAVQELLATLTSPEQLKSLLQVLGQVDFSNLLTVEVSAFRQLTGRVCTQYADVLKLMEDSTGPIEMRLLAARALNLAMIEVPAGQATLGSNDAQARSDEGPFHRIVLNAFWIDLLPITNLQYLLFLRLTGYLPPPSWDEIEVIRRRSCEPVVDVTFRDAMRYATWLGKRIPTEAEWEKVARDNDGRTWPWGDYELLGCDIGQLLQRHPRKVAQQIENRSVYGALDLIGGVWEWTSSLRKRYPYDAGDGREDLNSDGYRVLRGGSFRSPDLASARASIRNWDLPTHSDDWGFRCAYTRTDSGNSA